MGTAFLGAGFGVALGFVVGATSEGGADAAGGAVGPTAGRGVVLAVRSCADEIHAVMPAISTTTTMLMPTSGARVRA